MLTVEKIGNGSGTITSDLEGIDCGDDCAELYPTGTEVALTAVESSIQSLKAGRVVDVQVQGPVVSP